MYSGHPFMCSPLGNKSSGPSRGTAAGGGGGEGGDSNSCLRIDTGDMG